MQDTAIGQNLVTLKCTTASAVKEKEGKLTCQAEVLIEGKTDRPPIDTSEEEMISQALSYFRHCVRVIAHTALPVCLFLSDFELPRMNYDFNGKRHKFVYGTCVEESAMAVKVTFPVVLVWLLQNCYLPRGTVNS